MAKAMRLLAKWHIWLGWLAGVPLLMWCLSGLVMVAKPIEEVRGNHLRREHAPEALPVGNPAAIVFDSDVGPTIKDIHTFVQNGKAVTVVTRLDGRSERFDAVTGKPLLPFSDVEARMLVAREIIGGDKVARVRLYDADHPPLDFRKPVASWQVSLADGTHVYVGRDSGAIEAVRTRWWRVYDVVWGLHIMDLQTREDTHHPVLILFAALALVSTLMGSVLLFRRRRTRGATA